MTTAQEGNPLDLRAWIEHMRELGEIDEVLGADAQLEIGAISQLNVKRAGARALLFDEIPGYPAGWRVMSCSTSSPRRLSSILRLGNESSHQALVQKLRDKPAQWLATAKNFAPVSVSQGPVLENIQRGEQVNVEAFPAPLWNEKDGGRFIGTGCS
ncbi:MAG: UbiD family decarboxylase, partial [Betaproteobacteria bacterium]